MVVGFAAAIDNTVGVVGVAPGARVWAIRVADPNGDITDAAMLCGLNWVIEHANKIEVANMSLSGDATDEELAPCGAKTGPVHKAICKLDRLGVTSVAAAGNASIDAARSPRRATPK